MIEDILKNWISLILVCINKRDATNNEYNQIQTDTKQSISLTMKKMQVNSQARMNQPVQLVKHQGQQITATKSKNTTRIIEHEI